LLVQLLERNTSDTYLASLRHLRTVDEEISSHVIDFLDRNDATEPLASWNDNSPSVVQVRLAQKTAN
jgi:hypothetical protein